MAVNSLKLIMFKLKFNGRKVNKNFLFIFLFVSAVGAIQLYKEGIPEILRIQWIFLIAITTILTGITFFKFIHTKRA